MQRRQFLEIAGRVGTGLGIAGPLLGPEAVAAFPLADQQRSGAHNKDGQAAPTLASLLDSDWLIATDPGSVETIDETLLTLAKGDVIYDGVRDFLAESGAETTRAIHLVEYSGDDEASVTAKVKLWPPERARATFADWGAEAS